MPDMTDVTEKLQELTTKDFAPWKPTQIPDTFTAAFGPFTIRLSANPRVSAPNVTYQLSVLDEKQQEIDSVSYPGAASHPDNPVRQLPSLHKAAKSKALDVPKRLQELIDSLDRITPD